MNTAVGEGERVRCQKRLHRFVGRYTLNDDQAAERRLVTRLEELEVELLTLRRELGEEHRRQARLPEGDFQILRVAVCDDLFGIPIDSVCEIVRYAMLTRVTDVPSVVAGAVNVRGDVYAVIEARKRFGYPLLRPGYRTCIVLTESNGRTAGLVVDRVLDVVSVTRDALSEPTGALASAHCVAAISTINDQMVQVLDLALLLDVREWRAVTQALSEHPESTADGLPPEGAWDGGAG